jgi:hypothetical protein
MSRLNKHDRLAILELATEIASESAQNPNIVWMIEFQEQLVETLYRKMTDLIECDLEIAAEEDDDDDDDDEEEEEEKEEDAAAEESEAAELEHDEIKKKAKQKKAKKAA